MLEVNHNGALLEVRGSLDDDGGRRLLQAVAATDGDVRIDASGLDRIDGAGLTALVLARRECVRAGRRFELVEVAPEALVGLRAAARIAALLGPRPDAHATPTTPVPAARPAAPVTARADLPRRRARRLRWSRTKVNRGQHG